MRRALRIQPAAEADLDAFASFIARDSVEAAMRFLDAAQATFSLLAEMPFLGVSCDSFFQSERARNLRLWRIKGFPNHQILYRLTDDSLLIVRIVHAAQDKHKVRT